MIAWLRDWYTRSRLAVWIRGRRERALSRLLRRGKRALVSGVRLDRLERAIAVVAPVAAARRQAARVELRRQELMLEQSERLLGYKEGRAGSLAPRTQAGGASADYALELGYDRRNEVDRARGLERNNPLARLLLDRSTEHSVGEGLALKVKTKDEGWNKAAQEIWEDFVAHGDARGISTIHELMALEYRGWMRDGDGGFLLEDDGKVRAFESDELASPRGGYMTPSDIDGVELDARGRIKAFYLFDYDPKVIWPDRRRAIQRLSRIARENVIFFARRDRIGQTRGLSVFNGFHELLEQLADSLEAVAYAHVMAASFGLYFKKKTPIGYGHGETGSPPERPEVNFEPGMTVRVDADEEIGQINPTQPSESFDILINTLMMFAAAAFGLCVEMVHYSFKNTNYATMRAASLEVAAATRIKQHLMVREGYRSLWGWRLARAIRLRELTPRRDLHLHTWGIPGKPWVDPEVELRAAMGSAEACMDTRRAILARRGMDFEEVAKECAAEVKLLKKLGLADIRSVLTRDAVEIHETLEKGAKGSKTRARARKLLLALLS